MTYMFDAVEVSEGAALLHRRLSAHVSPADAKYNAFWELYARHPMTTKELKNWCTCTREYGAFRCADCPFAWLKNDDAEDGPNDCPRGWSVKDFGYVVELAKAIVQSKGLGAISLSQAEGRMNRNVFIDLEEAERRRAQAKHDAMLRLEQQEAGNVVGAPPIKQQELIAYTKAMEQLGAKILPLIAVKFPSTRVLLRRKLLGL